MKDLGKIRYRYVISACFLIYVASMIAKTIFTSLISVLIDYFQTTKAEISLANTFYFITYGIVQIFLSFLMKKTNIYKYLSITAPFSAILCFLVALCTSVKTIWIIFALNGIAQAGIYACCIEIISKNVESKYISKANGWMSVGFAFGCTFSYLLSAFCVEFFDWKLTFIISSIFFAGCIVYFIIVMINIRKEHIDVVEETLNKQIESEAYIKLNNKKEIIIFYIFAMIIAFFGSATYYAIMNWMVSFLKENFGLSDSLSIFISVGLPLVMAFGAIFAIYINNKQKNFVLNILYVSILPLIICVVMIFIFDVSIFVSVVLMFIYVVLSRTINTLYSSVVAFNMRSEIDAGSYSALANAVASVSAGVVPVVIGHFIENYGWISQFIVTAIFVVILMVASLFAEFLIIRKKRIENK